MVGFLLFLVQCAYGADVREVNILELSSSKRSAIVDLGNLDGLVTSERGQFYLRKEDSYLFVAAGEAIKVHPGRSYWILHNVEREDQLTARAKLVLAKLGKRGRSPWKVRQSRVLGKGAELGPLMNGRHKAGKEVLTSRPPTKAWHLEIRRTGAWQVAGSDYSGEYGGEVVRLILSPQKKGADQKAIKTWLEQQVAARATRGAVEKPPGFEAESQRGKDNLRLKDESQSYYQRLIDFKKRARELDRKAIKRLAGQDFSWSAGMDDEQLRRFFVRTGIASEALRQQKALSRLAGHELSVRYNLGLSDGQYRKDDQAYQARDYGLSFAYEFHLGRSARLLERFSCELEFQKGLAYRDLGGHNGRSSEGMFYGHLHWYANAPPDSLHRYLFYVGMGLGSGGATIESSRLNRQYRYRITGLPDWRFGMKYRFKAGDTRPELFKFGLGANLALAWESLKYSAVDVPRELIREQVMAANMQYRLWKLSMGLNFYF